MGKFNYKKEEETEEELIQNLKKLRKTCKNGVT